MALWFKATHLSVSKEKFCKLNLTYQKPMVASFVSIPPFITQTTNSSIGYIYITIYSKASVESVRLWAVLIVFVIKQKYFCLSK